MSILNKLLVKKRCVYYNKLTPQVSSNGRGNESDPGRASSHVREDLGRVRLRHPAGREQRVLRHDQRRVDAKSD